MASNPPFQMEDQTDEDFFDKLVSDDDIDLKGGVGLDAGVKGLCFGVGDGDDSDEGNAFANLSVDEVESDERKGENAGNDDTRRELGVGHNGEVGGVGEAIADVSVLGSNGLVVVGEPFGLGSEVESNLGNNSSEGSNGLLDAGVPFGLGSIVESNSGNNSSEGSNGLLVGGEPFGLDSGVESNCGNNSSVGLADSTLISKGSGSLGPGVKEWSAFDSDPAQDDAHGFGSYSDFFTGLDENAGDSFGNVGGSPTAEVSKPSQSEYTGVSNSYDHYQAGYGYEAAAEQGNVAQDTNSSEYWENLYPGWKIDPATGQWYQVDVHNSSASVQGNLESNPASAWSLSDGKSEVSYLQKSADSVAETMAESGRTETVTNLNQVLQFSGFDTAFSNQSQISQETENSGVASDWNQVTQETENSGVASDWNQVTQVDSGYPSYMLFDPQYPGWYYDTNTQEWLSLDSYTSSARSATQGQDLLNQSDFAGSNSYSQNDVQMSYGGQKQVNLYTGTQSHISHGQDYNSGGSLNSYNQPASGVWEPEGVTKNEMVPKYNSNHQVENHYTQDFSEINRVSQQETGGYQPSNYGKTNQVQSDFPAVSRRSHSLFSGENFTPQFNPQAMSRSHSFVSGENFMPQINHIRSEQTEQKVSSNQYFGNQNSASFPQQSFQSSQQYSYAPATGRSSAGRPPHALVTFGFGGKLIMMKGADSTGSFSSPSQNHSGYSVSVLNISEVIKEKADSQSLQPSTCDYFHALCRQSLPGPLAGGNIGSKELNKWLDERISSPEIRDMDFRKSDALRQLLSLLRIACQYYGKLRSPFGTDPMMKENDLPGPAVANLFSSAKRSAAQYGAVAHCLQGLPSEAHLRATAAEVQSLLVSGRKQEALHCAQEGQLWGPALVLAAQLGNQFYVDTVKQLALRQLVAGSPLRTLCLLIAGQPADVFSMEMAASSSMPGVANSPQQSMQLGANGMLDDWEENLAVIASNRTKDDELVLIHLGDCLWRERADIYAAHICYLVADTNFEKYSDSARLCLVGADHLKFPRTYASPEAIQRTEIYEYSQVLGNSQFVLIPFQPYKLVYAQMLAEVGRVSDALKYCQAVQKSLKTGRSAEVETLRLLASALEERIKTHQQGGFSTNLAPAKVFGKLFNLIDSTAQRVISGGLPPPVPGGSPKGYEHPTQPTPPRVSTSQSTMAMSSLMPSASVEPISEWTGDDSRKSMHNRSASEPDFGRSPRQGQVDSAKDANSMTNQGKAASRFGRFGSQLFQKTVGLVLKPRQDRQAKLGESNKFYYDEKLKRWVEEGADPPVQEAALPPPPPTSSFQNGPGTANYNLKTAVRDDGHLSNGSPEYKSHTPTEHNSGMPPLPPTSNQFSARGRTGVRSRYVDTFNQGGGNSTNLFSSPSVPSVRPAAGTNPKFFVPAPVSSTEIPDKVEGFSASDENPSVSTINESTHPPATISSVPMQRYPSVDNISSKRPTNGDAPYSAHSRRTASWSGSLNDSQRPAMRSEMKPLGEVLGMPPSSFMPSDSTLMHSSNSGSFGDELHEVEL